MTVLCVIAADGVVCRPVLVGTLFAPTQGLHFPAVHPLSFLFICTLHWCKYCTVLELAPNVRKFQITSLCEIATYGVVYGPVFVGTLFAPTQVLRFQAFHPLRFLIICTLHWCKNYSVLKVAMNVRIFPMTALCGIAAQRLICSPVLVGTLFAPTQGSRFQSLQPLSFLFTCNLYLCKHCTVLEVTTYVRKFPMTALCGVAADIFTGPPSSVHFCHRRSVYIFSHSIPLASFHMHLALVQAFYRVKSNHECAQISNYGAMRNCSAVTNLQSRPRWYALCTDAGLTFSCMLSIPLASFSYAPCAGASIVTC